LIAKEAIPLDFQIIEKIEFGTKILRIGLPEHAHRYLLLVAICPPLYQSNFLVLWI